MIAGHNFGISSSASYVWIVTVDGSAPPVEILHGKGAELVDVAWSPDGARIAFVRAARDIFTYDVATGALAQVTHGCTWKTPDPAGPLGDCPTIYGFHGALAWSPDGSRIAATTSKSLVIVDVATGAVTTLRTEKFFLDSAVWSPDGQSIAYGVFEGPSFRVPVAGGVPVQVASSTVSSWQACPDGSCATLGAPRRPARITLSTAASGRRLTISGRVKPSTDEQPREFLAVTLRVRSQGRWRPTKTIEGVRLDESAYEKKLRLPVGETCKVTVVYPGGWRRSGARTSKTFAC